MNPTGPFAWIISLIPFFITLALPAALIYYLYNINKKLNTIINKLS